MLLNLTIRKFEDLQSIRECCLGSLSFSKIINDLLVRICLLNIIIIKINNSIAIRECFPSNSIWKNYFLFAISKRPLYFTIVSNDLILYVIIFSGLVMIKRWELHLIILLLRVFLSPILIIFFFFFMRYIVARLIAFRWFELFIKIHFRSFFHWGNTSAIRPKLIYFWYLTCLRPF